MTGNVQGSAVQKILVAETAKKLKNFGFERNSFGGLKSFLVKNK